MYGKTYESMYDGSMIGSGIHVFAVWNYVITKARGGIVEVNPKLLAFTLGGTEKQITDALMFLQKPDTNSRSKDEGGRRLVKEGQFQYRIVNWERYAVIKNAVDRREYNRVWMQEDRLKKKMSGKKTGLDDTPASAAFKAEESAEVKKYENGEPSQCD
jgi:hypothetical protein